MALPLTHKRILIVEDEQVFRSVLVGYLASLGAETGEATNGIQALGAVDDFKPDLILCDLAMPEMGGIEFVEHLRLQGLQIPVLVISATDKMADIAKVLRLGVQDVLLKPLTDLNRLREAVLACLYPNMFTSQAIEEVELFQDWDALSKNPSEAVKLLKQLRILSDTERPVCAGVNVKRRPVSARSTSYIFSLSHRDTSHFCRAGVWYRRYNTNVDRDEGSVSAHASLAVRRFRHR